jgi:hypothetical protein
VTTTHDPIMNLVGELLEGLRDGQETDVYVHQLVGALRGAGPEDVGRIIVEAFKAMAKNRAELTDMVVDRTRWASPVPVDMGRNCPVAPAMNVTLTYLAQARAAEVRDAVNKARNEMTRTETRTDLTAAIAARNTSATRPVVEAAAKLAEERNITVEEIEGEHGAELVAGLTDEAHNNLAAG